MTVIIEPDTVGAWIGLVGVAMGAGLTGGFEWLRTRQGDRKQRRRELLIAGWKLERRADLLVLARDLWESATAANRPGELIYMGVPGRSDVGAGSRYEWMKFFTEGLVRQPPFAS